MQVLRNLVFNILTEIGRKRSHLNFEYGYGVNGVYRGLGRWFWKTLRKRATNALSLGFQYEIFFKSAPPKEQKYQHWRDCCHLLLKSWKSNLKLLNTPEEKGQEKKDKINYAYLYELYRPLGHAR